MFLPGHTRTVRYISNEDKLYNTFTLVFARAGPQFIVVKQKKGEELGGDKIRCILTEGKT